MGDFRGNSRGFGGGNRGRGGFGGDRNRGRGRGGFGGDRDRRPREMHDVVCDKCKKDCQVPFRPSTDKPVLCSDCFEKKGGNSSRGGSSGISKEQLNQLNAKLDKIMAKLEIVPEKKEAKEEAKEESEDSE